MGLFDLFKKKELSFENNQTSLTPLYDEYQKISVEYYNGLDQIEAMWSVITNLGLYNGQESEKLIQKCKTNIHDLNIMIDYGKTIDNNYGTIPTHVPAYVRLAMLYEKREDYQSGISVCIEAIKAGAINDGSKGKMYGRLARLIKKSGIEPTNEMIKMISMK